MQERWVWIKGYEGFYQISDCGRMRSFKNGRWSKRTTGILLSPGKSSNGYYSVVLYLSGIKKTVHIPRLVAKHFIPNPENKPQVNHKDGNKLNDHYTNLEWATQSENMIHAFKFLNRKAVNGENHWNAKLTNKKVKEIRELYKTGKYSQEKIGDMFMVDLSSIHDIVTNKTWKGLI